MDLSRRRTRAHLEKGDDILRRAGELFPELLLLRGDSHRTVVRVADPGHDAPLRDHGDRPEPFCKCKHSVWFWFGSACF